MVKSLRRRFLWSGGADATKTALIAWERLCCPQSTGDLGFVDISVRNKAAFCKHLWSVPKSTMASWMIQKILRSIDFLC